MRKHTKIRGRSRKRKQDAVNVFAPNPAVRHMPALVRIGMPGAHFIDLIRMPNSSIQSSANTASTLGEKTRGRMW
jgi:hypothetical protein